MLKRISLLMKQRAYLHIKWIFVLLIFLISCVTVYDTINNRNFAKKYNPGVNQMHPYYSIFQYSQDELRLYFQIFPKEFAFVVPENDSVLQANVSLFFRVTKTYSSIEIIDSLTTNFPLKGNPRPHLTGFVPINLPDSDTYVLEVFLTDRISKAMVSNVFNIQKQKEGAYYSFMFLSQYASPVFHNYFTTKDTFRLRNNMLKSRTINVRQILPDTILPLPPDVSRKEQGFEHLVEDTLYTYPQIDTTLLWYSKQGVYVFSDVDYKSSRAVSVFNEWYPYVKTPKQLLRPLAYLNTPREMQKLWVLNDPKKAVDSFWFDATNDYEKARELIRIYYNRVQLANYYFTNYKEGWLTDRGMIYIIFGMPSNVTIEKDGESWVYGKGTEGDLVFFFYRDKHPVFGEYFILNRSDQYSRIWFNATSTWRSGRVFSLNP